MSKVGYTALSKRPVSVEALQVKPGSKTCTLVKELGVLWDSSAKNRLLE
jgi:hypothetical protein